MEEENKLIKENCLLQAIDKLGRGSKFLWIIFIINILTSILWGINGLSYIFIAEVPEYCCSTPELENANWTMAQINNVSMVDECQKYDHNYTHLVNLGYENATKYVNELEFKPKIVYCTSFTFNNSKMSTIVDEWQLVCDKKLHRASTFLVYAVGMTCGSGILGTYADKYGRKNSLIIGMSMGAVYSSAFTILSEVSKDNLRKIFAAVLDCMSAVGTFCLVGMAYFIPNWRYLQMAISCFILPIAMLIWFIPESPRWLIAQNRHDEAQKIIEKYYKSFVMTSDHIVEGPSNEPRLSLSEHPEILKKDHTNCFHRNSVSLRILFKNSDLRKKLLIMYVTNYVTALVGFSLILSIDNFKSDRYIYMSIVGVNEILAHITASAVLIYFSCRNANILAYTVAFILMITILAVQKSKNIVIGLALAAKFCFSASYTANLVLNSELFPSIVRNTAFGTSLVMAQIGTMTAPYIVDLLGNVAWWAPTTLCSVLALIAGFLCLLIPQIKLIKKSDTNVNKQITVDGSNS
ncbi:organic cation transporter protein-like isoform X2 [Microplitis mediator]|uniref:organic cation transporter protein-like isoform X2 n=1 Tax=Microplitis mediator TaxID=375433 RepID=UPI0025575916|nr:organic cation transporter protein-like isoform X2 [Microplitis mediator]